MAYENRSRGVGGCGFAYPTKKGWKIQKRALDLANALDDGAISNIFDKDVLLGHTRAPSKGLGAGSAVIDANTHPWIVNGVGMAHNGRFRNDTAITKSHLDGHGFNVDSEALCALVAKVGAEKAFSLFEGTAATWYFNKNDTGKFWLWCWDQDLALWVSDSGAIAFSSEIRHLRRAGFTSKNGELGEVPRKGSLIEIDLASPKLTFTTKTVVGYDPPPVKYTQQYQSGYGDYGRFGNAKAAGAIGTGALKSEFYKLFSVHDPVWYYIGMNRIVGRVMGVSPRDDKVCVVANSEGVWVEASRTFKICVQQTFMTKELEEAEKKEAEEPSAVVDDTAAAYFPADVMHRIITGATVPICNVCGAIAFPNSLCHVCGSEIPPNSYRQIKNIKFCGETDCGFVGAAYETLVADLECPDCGADLSFVFDIAADKLDILMFFVYHYIGEDAKESIYSLAEVQARTHLSSLNRNLYDGQRRVVFKQRKLEQDYDSGEVGEKAIMEALEAEEKKGEADGNNTAN